MSTILEILVFFFFLGILILMLTGRYILKQFRKMQNAVEQAAEQLAPRLLAVLARLLLGSTASGHSRNSVRNRQAPRKAMTLTTSPTSPS